METLPEILAFSCVAAAHVIAAPAALVVICCDVLDHFNFKPE